MSLTNTTLYLFLLAFLGTVTSCTTSRDVAEKPEAVLPAGGAPPASDTWDEALAQKHLVQQKETEISMYRGSRERKFDLLHTSLDLQFDYENQWVIGEAMLRLKPYFFDQEVLELDAKDFEVHEAWLQQEEERRPLGLRYNGQVVTIYLPGKFTARDTLSIGMRYTAMPNENSGQGSEAITDNKGLYFINPEGKEGKPVQIWTQGETEHNSKWFPTIDSPNERATQDIRVRVKDKDISVSNGVLVEQIHHGDGTRTDHWVMDQPHAPYLTALVVGEFATVEDSAGSLPLRYIVEPAYAEGAKKVFGNSPKMVRFFSELLGVEFPWQNYDQIVVRDFVSGAMENTTASIFMEALNMDEREAIDSEWDYIIAHELFHQWFGNLVTLESWANLPLNEAFADYSEYLWMEHHEGRDPADMHHVRSLEDYFLEAEEKQVDLIRYYYDTGEDMFDHHSYAKGGRVLHMLRKYLGDEAFFASLNLYLTKHAYSSVEIHDLRMAFEEVSGRDMNWFFNQWFLAPGHPVLDIRFDYSQPDNVLLTVRQKQDLTRSPLYKIPFTVSWYSQGTRKETTFMLDRAVQQFALENGPDTDLVLFDESLVLLAKKDTYRGREYFEKQAVVAESGISRYEALDSVANRFPADQDIRRLFARALDDRFSSIREFALANLLALADSMPLTAAEEEKIVAMAKKDPDNAVRAGAIDLLNKTGPDKYADLFMEFIGDSSYYVAGAALNAYLENRDNPERDAVAEGLMDTDNIQVVVPLAEYFIQLGDTARADWFHEKISRLNGESLYYFLGYYGDYFARFEALDHEPALRKLFQLAENHPAGYVRLAAFQALMGFIDEEGVPEKARELNAAEKDETVKKYQQFFLGTDGDMN